MRKNFHVKVSVINLKTEEPDGKPRSVNFSSRAGQAFLHNLIFACINTGKGVVIELDKEVPANV